MSYMQMLVARVAFLMVVFFNIHHCIKNTTTNECCSCPMLKLPSREKLVPFVFVADVAFALSENIMKPYPGHKPGSSSPERVFNYRLSRARRIIENVFGIMSAKFKIFLKSISLHPDEVETVKMLNRRVFTLPLVHLIQMIPTITLSPDHREKKLDSNALMSLQTIPRKAVSEVQQIPDEFREYFMSDEGTVSWQYSYS
ncbi:hypothetical protein J437_LFUL004273 [Ladona fulva]|uniref:DDE Tnp4 domain-containing protein n=1 Tax=Ladona fulva TaxID=123851 RepID=A0A8K0KEL9_LADFU|nr:hypothetical protein J437_LFUL004273 [Ladona fulva]